MDCKHDEKWDEAYRTGAYKGYWGLSYPSQELVSLIASTPFPENAKALDVGCGAGQESIFLAKQGFQVIGVDLSMEGLNIARQSAKEEGIDVDFQYANVLELPVGGQSIDLMNDRGCFHIIPDEQRPLYAAEAARVLKPGGKVLLRGCRDEAKENEEDPFFAITPCAIERYFGEFFTWGPIVPIQLASGQSGELNANLVVLTRNDTKA